MKREKLAKKYNICVVGAGHVGLVAAAGFADLGHKVICVDNNKARIAALKKNIMPFYEPDMEGLVKKNFKAGTLLFSPSLDEGIKKSQVIFIAVGTPPLPDGSADLTAIENVAMCVAKNLDSHKVIVEKSTVPVQTGQRVKETINRYKNNDVEFDVVSNPEFLREGKAVYDFFFPDRLVIGAESARAKAIMQEIYSPIKTEFVFTDINTAELIKHASNSFLATKISFINAVSRVCDLAGADVDKVALAMGLDKRIGPQFLNAGVGYGGFCFPKDVEAFTFISKKLGYDFGILKEVKRVNDEQRSHFVNKIKERLWVLKGKKIAVLGLSFKPDTDDMRFAPSEDIVNLLAQEGASLSLYDPKAKHEAQELFKAKNITFAKDSYTAVKGADCVCFLTEWAEFKKLDMAKVKKSMKHPLLADGRNMLDKSAMIKLGYEYIGMGR
jgi:UDPglucose 6-dehydrogenase